MTFHRAFATTVLLFPWVASAAESQRTVRIYARQGTCPSSLHLLQGEIALDGQDYVRTRADLSRIILSNHSSVAIASDGQSLSFHAPVREGIESCWATARILTNSLWGTLEIANHRLTLTLFARDKNHPIAFAEENLGRVAFYNAH